MYNNPGDSAIDFAEGRLDLDGMIVDHFLKRPVFKDKAVPNIKPFVLLCKFFSELFSVTKDDLEYYITTFECKNYLYNCQKYSDIDAKLIKEIITDRHSGVIMSKQMDDNETTNFSIWFNALKLTSLINARSSNELLVPNKYAKPFFDYIGNKATDLEPTPTWDDKGDSSLQYEYYCNRSKGINEIIPRCIRANVKISNNEEAQKLFLFLFGLKDDIHFKSEKYVKNSESNFGIYYPFLTLPYIALRHIWMQNSFIADALYKLIKGNKPVEYSISNTPSSFTTIINKPDKPPLPDNSLGPCAYARSALRNLLESGYVFTDKQLKLFSSIDTSKAYTKRNLPMFWLLKENESRDTCDTSIKKRYWKDEFVSGKYRFLMFSQWYDDQRKGATKHDFIEWYNSL